LKLIEVAGQMFVEKKDRLKLLVFSHWLNPRAKVMFNGAHDPAGLGLGHGCLYPCIIPQDVTGAQSSRPAVMLSEIPKSDVCLWHQPDQPGRSGDVRCLGTTGNGPNGAIR
jgi:hypothetical protein